MENKSAALTAGLIGMAGAVCSISAIVIHNSFNLSTSPSLNNLFQILGEAGYIGQAFGILGLIWGGAVKSRFGKIAVALFALGTLFIVIAGLIVQITGAADSLLFPIGGLISMLGIILTGIAVFIDKSWSGWRWYVLLLFTGYEILFIMVPLFAGLESSDGPGMLQELGQAILWFLIGLAVYTSQRQHVSLPSSPDTQ
jgi:hypothetical protein